MANAAARFYCPNLPHPRLAGSRCELDAHESHHARKVLRLKPGAPVELFDGAGGLARGRLVDYDGRTALCEVNSVERIDPLRPQIVVAAAVPKAGRAEPMVNQLSQVGADRFVPMMTQRSVVDPREGKLERFERHAIESAKQCSRLHVLTVEAAQSFETLLTDTADVRLLAAPGDGSPTDLPERVHRAARVLVLVGPEGGFTDEELTAADKAGFERWAFGPYVMRIETAAVVAAAMLRQLS
ncbi:16S rRNA (uracil(1498)-N(3))-methyltransferase [Phycisphaerales bacterium AB-hyl4]|uniref:Ribosomal RNA small subunit methyltransferase E n=1 Tax=Natronomicrosphaera hydrolytica TaxID=3242702 RepID=A0ABV4UAL5_9BACT